jgi:hypothetical protein
MGFEIFLMGIMIGIFLHSSGYATFAYASVLLSFLFMLMDNASNQRSHAPSVKVKGAQMLEPIVIEVPKGPPYQIPKFSMMKVNPYWGGNPGYEKMANAVGGMFRYGYAKVMGRNPGQ